MNIINQIQKLKVQRNAVILAHSYERPEIIDIADFVGDSLGLSQKALETTADVIVFAGVRFMAETAKILNPTKTVLLPVTDAGCPMADMITADGVRALKQAWPGYKTVCYINTTAEVKAECDYCVTSANAVKMVQGIEGSGIIFVPDKNLGSYVAKKSDLTVVTNCGYCPIHNDLITLGMVLQKKAEHPKAMVIAHPECTADVVALADMVCSTEKMLNAPNHCLDDTEFIIATEVGIKYRLEQKFPRMKFIMVNDGAICNDMKKTRLTDILNVLKNMTNEITVVEEVAIKAKRCINTMFE